jgi:hypothetical protein
MLEAAASIIRREKMRGPWDLETRDGDILIVDEAHNVIPPVGICDYRKEWQRYLSELRHQGVTCVLISQDMDLMDRRCMLLAEQRKTLTNRANLKHIAFGCKAYFWYDVVHAFTGQPWFVFQKDVLLKYNGRWVPESSSPVVASLQVFESYQSRSKSYVTGKGAGDYAAPSRRKALRSFLWAAWPGLIVRAFVFSAIIWVVAFQGGGTAVNFIMKTMFRMAGNKTEQTAPGLVEAAVEDQGGGVLPEVERDYLEDLRVNLAARGLVLESCSPVPLREYWSDRELRADYRLKRIGSRVWLSARVSGSRRAGLQQFSKGFSQAGKGFKSLYERR